MLYFSRSTLLAPSSNISFGILMHSLCLNFTFIFRIFYAPIFRFGKTCVQSLLVFGILFFFWTLQMLSHALWDFGTTSPSCFVLWCFYAGLVMLRLFRIPAGYSPHTSISALNIRSLFSSVLHSGLGGFGGPKIQITARKPKPSSGVKGLEGVSRSLLYSTYFYNHLFVCICG